MSVILDLPFSYSVWISSAVAIVYTLLGGLYAVAYTDVIQLALTFFSLVSVFRQRQKHWFGSGDLVLLLASVFVFSGRQLRCSIRLGVSRQWLCVPFLLLSPVSVNIAETAFNSTFQEPWLGTLVMDDIWKWVDDFLMLVSPMSHAYLRCWSYCS